MIPRIGGQQGERYREVATVLARHGLGALNAQLGLTRFVPPRLFARDGLPHTPAEHVRLAIEDLGTTAIKLGQILSTRPDLIPTDLSAELEKLRDQIPAVDTATIVAEVERQLGCPVQDAFASFEEAPLAAASIGQVHGATLRDGTRVVVKVRKPGVKEQVNTDLAILAGLARRARNIEALAAYDVEGIADDFAWTLRAELDYVREGRNADRLREALAEDERLVVPRVHWDLTREGVIVLDRVDGIRISDIAALDAAGIDRRALAKLHAEALMRQVFYDGFFHADPHPGNFLVLSDGRMALLDFGMAGQLDAEVREALLQLFVAVTSQDSAAVTDAMEHLGILRSPALRDAVRRDVHHVLSRYYGLSVAEFSLREYLDDVFAVVRRHRLVLPADLALVLKTVGMSEGLWRQLDPAFNAAEVAEPFVREAATGLYAPRAWGRRVARAAADTIELGAYLPGQIRRIASRIDRGELEVTLQHRELNEALDRFGAMVSRLAAAIVFAAFILGLPVIAVTYEPPGWSVIAPVWFFGGTVAVLVLFLRLLLGRGR